MGDCDAKKTIWSTSVYTYYYFKRINDTVTLNIWHTAMRCSDAGRPGLLEPRRSDLLTLRHAAVVSVSDEKGLLDLASTS